MEPVGKDLEKCLRAGKVLDKMVSFLFDLSVFMLLHHNITLILLVIIVIISYYTNSTKIATVNNSYKFNILNRQIVGSDIAHYSTLRARYYTSRCY